MSDLLDEIKKYIGTESEPVVYSIDAGAIKFFAESIMNPDPLYWNQDYAKTTRHGEIVAPPTFYGGATSLRNIKSDDPRTGSSTHVPTPPGSFGLNSGDDFELLAPVKPGDTLTCREKVADAYEKQGRSGHLIFVVREKTLTNQHGQVVLLHRATSVFISPASKEESHQ